jgi:hypothetical protein
LRHQAQGCPHGKVRVPIPQLHHSFTVKDDAVLYVDRGSIVAVQDCAMAAPAGFENVAPVDTGATLFRA